MSWIHKLYETYDRCAGQPQFDKDPLMPVDHSEQQVHIEITLDGSGKFRAASVVSKETTFIPATEDSAGRTSAPAAHGLADKLEYIAPSSDDSRGVPDGLEQTRVRSETGKNAKKEKVSPHTLYLDQLSRWVASEDTPDPHVKAVLDYVKGGTVIEDLLKQGILHADLAGNLLTRWSSPCAPPLLFKVLTATAGERNQRAAVVRWTVELPEPQGDARLWLNSDVQRSWQQFVARQAGEFRLCIVTGEKLAPAANHPKRLRHGADGAKLISSNDSSGYTFRGRFEYPEHAYGIGRSTTQKAHTALRWLIARQGYKNGDQVIVAWAVSGQRVPEVIAASDEMETGHNIFVQSDDRRNDSARSLRERAESTEYGLGKQAFALTAKKKKKTKVGEDTAEDAPVELAQMKETVAAACAKWFDVRAFGNLFAWKAETKKKSDGAEAEGGANEDNANAGVSIAIRGPVTVQSAFSLLPVDVTSTQITKSVSGEGDGSKRGSDTMGMKHRVDAAVYVFYGSMNPQLAERTGFNDADSEAIKALLPKLFENDASSARPDGSMAVLKVLWWKHNSKAGQFSSAKVHGSLLMDEDGSGRYKLRPLDGLIPEEIDGF